MDSADSGAGPDAFVTWATHESHYRELQARPLDAASVDAFLRDWTAVTDLIEETHQRLRVAVDRDTADDAARERLAAFLAGVYAPAQEAEQALREKLLASGIEPAGLALPLRRLRTEAEIFRPENLPLEREEQALQQEYARITGAQTVVWQGEEIGVRTLDRMGEDPDRRARARAWRLAMERRLQDGEAIVGLWRRLLEARHLQAVNAGFPDYRADRWQQLARFDYTPEDCLRIHHAIEEWVTPVVVRLHEERRVALGLRRLQPWDLRVDLAGRPPLRPFSREEELIDGVGRIMSQLDPIFGEQATTLAREGLLDLIARPNKAPGGYCTAFPHSGRPFILLDATGIGADLTNLFHELGHASHVFAAAALPYSQQRTPPAEAAEMAAMSMELLAMSCLEAGGFYDAAEAARARREHLLQRVLSHLPAMAMVDAFQHWAYTHREGAADPDACGRQWRGLWLRFLPGVDWSGLDEALAAEWQSRIHLFLYAVHYLEYGLAQLA